MNPHTHLQLAFVNASASYAPSDTLSFQSDGYCRGFWQAHVDGNGTDAQPYDPTSVLAGQLCIGDGLNPTRTIRCAPAVTAAAARSDLAGGGTLAELATLAGVARHSSSRVIRNVAPAGQRSTGT
jgi:hypothetical protein